MLYRAVSHRYGAVAAEGESLIVTFSYATNTKAPVSDDLRARLLELGGSAGVSVLTEHSRNQCRFWIRAT